MPSSVPADRPRPARSVISVTPRARTARAAKTSHHLALLGSAGRASISEARTVRRLRVFVQACAFAEGRTVDFHASPIHVIPDLGGTCCTSGTVVMSVARVIVPAQTTNPTAADELTTARRRPHASERRSRMTRREEKR